ncbi:SurA N-terminal domain-containing protein [Membranihabitans marinus]
MDMVGNSSQSQMGNLTIGEVNGEKVDYRNFMAHEEAVYSGGGSDVYSRRNYLWNYYLNKTLFENEAEEMGVSVGKEELLELQFGSNISPVIQQRFSNPNTGGVDYQQLNSLRQQIQSGTMPEETKRFWSWQEKEIMADRTQKKIENIVAKSFYTPSWMVEDMVDQQNNKVEFAYVKIPFDQAKDMDIQVTDTDIQEYLKKNQNQYLVKEEQRKLEYMTLSVMPTSRDSAEIRNQIVKLMDEFAKVDNDTTFIQNNEGIFTSAYELKEDVPAVIADAVFEDEIGSIVGPYELEGSIRATKIVDRKVIPDSVLSRHILFTGQTQQDLIAGFQKADSLKNLIETGVASFDSLAIKFSQGPSAPNGGDLGYAGQGQMVQQFNDLIFFNAEIGELNTVVTQFGVHLVEVLDRKYINKKQGVQLATVYESIIPSQQTQDSLYDVAQEFVSSNRTLTELRQSIADKPQFRLQIAPAVKKNDFLFGTFGGGNVSRDIVRWAFENSTSVDEVSSIVYIYQNPQLFYNDRYVIVGLDEVMEAGLPKPEDVRMQVEQIILDEKKGQSIAASVAGTSNLDELAQSYNLSVDTARNASFSADFIDGIGQEPKLVAMVTNGEIDQINKPVVGTTGVFVTKVLGKSRTNLADYSSVRANSVSQMAQQVSVALPGALKEKAEIKDNRSDFY